MKIEVLQDRLCLINDGIVNVMNCARSLNCCLECTLRYANIGDFNKKVCKDISKSMMDKLLILKNTIVNMMEEHRIANENIQK